MLLYQLLKAWLLHSEWLPVILYALTVVIIMIKVKSDCKKLDAPFGKYVLLVLYFPLIFGILWLVVWPGALRLAIAGKSISDTPVAKSYRRVKTLKNTDGQEN